MRWHRLFLPFFFVPALILGLDHHGCSNIYNQAVAEWERHSELIEQYKKVDPNDAERMAPLIKESLECCRRAIACCDTILKDIASKHGSDRKKPWCDQLKAMCEHSKKNFSAEVSSIQPIIQQIEGILASDKANTVYQRSVEKVLQANSKERTCQRRLSNVNEVVAVLNEAASLYDEAASIAREALALVAPYPSQEKNQESLKQIVENYQKLTEKYRREAVDWRTSVTAQKITLATQLEALKEDSRLFTERGLRRSCYELQKQSIPILEQLIEISTGEEAEAFKGEQALLQAAVCAFGKEADSSRLTNLSPLSPEEFKVREKERKELFFKSDVLLHPDLFLSTNLNTLLPRVVPLDGQAEKKEEGFVLYTEQFYRFLVQSDLAVSELFIKVYENGQAVSVEKISLPFGTIRGWESYLKNGMLFVPESKLKSNFGFDLRLSFAYDPANKFSMIIAQKGTNTRYQFSISLTQETSLYECRFSTPPPWQLEILRKPALTTPSPRLARSSSGAVSIAGGSVEQLTSLETRNFPVLDQLVEELKKDPLALAGYVQNEIALVEPYLHQENGIFLAPGIHRSPCATYLEGQGSPWEQCQLLVYLLRKAGYQALYAISDSCSLPKDFVEKMLFTKLPEDQKEGLLKYPWVMFSDGKKWISLFPWMKEIQLYEGYDLYNFMPEEYASANRWILRYLKGDEQILKHIGPDGDDTAGILFVRFVEEELRKQGFSLNDVGIHRIQLKKQFSSWKDFPRPSFKKQAQVFDSLNGNPDLFAMAKIEVCSRQNPQKTRSYTVPLAILSQDPSSISFSRNETNQLLHFQVASESVLAPLELDESDNLIDIKIICKAGLSTESLAFERSLSIAKGTTAAICFHFGGAGPKTTSQFYDQFSAEKDEKKRLLALLSFVGASYFEKCSRGEKILADLHKVNPSAVLAFGLSELSPDLKSASGGDEDLMLPRVDMIWICVEPSSTSYPSVWHQERYTGQMQCNALAMANSSSNEHQILREVFKDQYAISTVKLLQLAHQQQQKNGSEGEGFLSFTATNFKAAEETPEASQSLHFPHLKDLNLREVQAVATGQWGVLKKLLDPNNPLSRWSYAYMTPGLVASQDGSYKEIGTLILSPYALYALISSNNLVFHGGLGSPLPSNYFAPPTVKKWQLVQTGDSDTKRYTLEFPADSRPQICAQSAITQSHPGTDQWTSDVRPDHKSFWNEVSDPVDVVTGAFYIDEVDLSLPGSFPIQIRRNYNSQNPLVGDLGCGWKLSLNPFLVEQNGKRFAAELDGTVITYSYNQQTSRWEVFPNDNPDLSNFNKTGIGSSANPFHFYIENDVLYGTDGSKRFFDGGLLKKWVNARGSVLTFFYDNEHLSRIENSSGDFCGLHYNHEGRISEIYAKDGRRISYDYNSQGDLVMVTLPNTAIVVYEYDRIHRIIRETKPHGKVLENIYDDNGRVKEQRSPMGPQQEMITTATFDYTDGITAVTDAGGGKTTYKIFEKQIYKITDPLGDCISHSWFIDKDSWFDPETEQVVAWDQKGGAIKSLKSTTDKRGLTTYYLYDSRGNPEVIGLKGEDLTGSGEQIIAKKFSYNDLNLCIEEEVCGQKTITIYDSAFPYLPKRLEKYSKETLLSYIDWEYNSLGQVEIENVSGAITFWEYDDRGEVRQKRQLTGTEDPDVITTYAYNFQGQCIKITSDDSVQENDYDLMGNQTESKIFSRSGSLLSASYIGYDLNNSPVWKQSANSEKVLYFDYHASGLIKATRQTLPPGHSVAYTLYEYDPRGYLIEETDPRGYCTYRDYDALGKIKSETKEGISTLFSYEPGGLVETTTSPSGGQTTHRYTTNGLLKLETYPDGTKNSVVYDFFGRPVLEINNDIAWETEYDDANHRVVQTHLKTKHSEISEFDARGNLIRFTDSAGFTSKKTYDSLNRIKTETTPNGKQTYWTYRGNAVICITPSGETAITFYEGGRAAKSNITNSRGNTIASSLFSSDAEGDREELVQGEETTITWKNAFGLPIKVEKGEITTTYDYDACGNCIVFADGDRRTIRQKFDGLGRLIRKELPDGSAIEFTYDVDSNLTEYRLPNGNVWKASYDSMRRKRSEELQAGTESSGRWIFTYENGYLKEAVDPMQRTHTYLYDPYGRVAQDSVNGSRRVYTYDPRGLLAAAEQFIDETPWLSGCGYGNNEHSLVERSYDADGNLSLESIYLNSNLIQRTCQKRTSSGRSLQIGNHQRNFVYQNNRIVQISTQNVDLSYTYDLNGALKSKRNRLSTTTIDYNASGLPKSVRTQLPDRSYQESLEWYPSGKLRTYSALGGQQQFAYDARGYLKSTELEKYDFDFGSAGTGVRTSAPGWYVPQAGLDAFGKILTSIAETTPIATGYNSMGQVVAQDQKQLKWDPWGRLFKVTDPSFTWEASYDALGRRLQTHYGTAGNPAITTTSFYDPEERFQEIGIQVGDKTFWKLYGPDSCEAIVDETGASVVLINNRLGQLAGVLSQQGTLLSDRLPSAYGPHGVAPIPSDLVSYAQSLSWHSKAQDPTGLIWMGERYYDSSSGRFLSPDPVSYPMCLDLYVYANGDPINYIDPNGRFASHAYQAVKPAVIESLHPFQGYNNLSSYCANNGLTRSGQFQVGSSDLPNGVIAYTNGINTTQDQFLENTEWLSRSSQGTKIHGTYNATNSLPVDVAECALGHIGIHAPPVQLLKNRWNHQIATFGPDAKFLEIVHSGGADHLKNALLSSPESVRQRIIVLAIAPSVIIPRKLCYSSDNYISRRDFVTHLDVFGEMRYGSEVHILEPHPNANFWDHDFLSPTFEEPLKRHIRNYIDDYGEK